MDDIRLITIRLVTQVREGELLLSLSGFWRLGRFGIGDLRSVEIIHCDPVRDFGGYGVRAGRFGKAFVASGDRGVRLILANNATVVIGSQIPEKLAGVLSSLGVASPTV